MTNLLTRPDDLVLGDGPLAVDTEFHAENRYFPTLHLIQVKADGHPAQLIDPHRPGLIAAVAPRLLSRPWIVHSGMHDLPILQRALGDVPPIVYDTQIAAGLVERRYPAGLAWLLDTWLDIQLTKAETLSDWSKRPLTSGQIDYAALDVDHLHALWNALLGRAEELDRTDTVLQACAAHRDDVVGGVDVGTLWSNLPGAHGLDGLASSALQELTIWREKVARATDRPPHSILPNRVLLDLAKRRPASLTELLQGRRAPKKPLRANADPLLAAIHTAVSRPDFAHLQPIRPGNHAYVRFTWLTAYAERCAFDGEWAARLVLPPDLCRSLARSAQPELGWREHLLQPDLEAALRGDKPISYQSGTESGS